MLRHCNSGWCLNTAGRMQTYMQILLIKIPWVKRQEPARRHMSAGMNWKNMVALPGTKSALTRWVSMSRLFSTSQQCCA